MKHKGLQYIFFVFLILSLTFSSTFSQDYSSYLTYPNFQTTFPGFATNFPTTGLAYQTSNLFPSAGNLFSLGGLTTNVPYLAGITSFGDSYFSSSGWGGFNQLPSAVPFPSGGSLFPGGGLGQSYLFPQGGSFFPLGGGFPNSYNLGNISGFTSNIPGMGTSFSPTVGWGGFNQLPSTVPFPSGGSLFPSGGLGQSYLFPQGGSFSPLGGGFFPTGFYPWMQPSSSSSSSSSPPNPVDSIVVTADSPVPVGTDNSIVVKAYDKNGNLTNGGDLVLHGLPLDGAHGGDYEPELNLNKESKGVYSTGLFSEWAGRYQLIASDTKTNVREVIEVEYLVGPAVDIVFSSTRPQPDGDQYSSCVNFYLADAYGNSLPPNPDPALDPIIEVPPDWTVVNKPINTNGTYSFDLQASNWGLVPVTVTDDISGISEVYDVTFPPIFYSTEQDLDPINPPEVHYIGDDQNDVDIYAEFPEDNISMNLGLYLPDYKELGTYDIEILFDANVLDPVTVTDPDPTDGYPLPAWNVINSTIFLNGAGAGGIGGVEVAKIEFTPLKTGPTTATVNHLQVTEISGGYVIVEVPFLWDTITILKHLKRLIVPIKKWIVDADGNGTTAAEKQTVRDELDQMEKVFHEAAKACVLDYWILFIVEYNEISKAKWEEYAGADGKLTPAERANMYSKSQYPPDKWVNIYNVPPCSLLGSSGGSVIGVWGHSGYIYTDKSKDTHDRNIAHELVHEFSGSDVKDSPKPNASAQGGREPNNIMRYCGGGSQISPKQGELINDGIGDNSETYDTDNDGQPEGTIYRP